jgi:hypothetical protein
VGFALTKVNNNAIYLDGFMVQEEGSGRAVGIVQDCKIRNSNVPNRLEAVHKEIEQLVQQLNRL